jgi:uncharacterized protein (TIGR03435 family)
MKHDWKRKQQNKQQPENAATIIRSMLETVACFLTGIIATPILLHSQYTVAQTQPQGRQTQSTQTALPSFEAASVRPSSPNEPETGGFYTYPGGRIVARGCSVKLLIMIAFDLQDFQIASGPSWADGGERFDIQAKPPDSSLSAQWKTSSTKISPGLEEREMLQSLLADRFHLVAHREIKEGSVYILRRGSNDLKLTTPKNENEYPWAGGISGGLPGSDGIRGTNISMPQLATRLSSWLGRPVIDKTGIQGSFDFEFHSGEDDSSSSMDITDSILTSINSIGLNLKSSRGPVETIVIDHVEGPSPN